ncbi:expressed unknown protein [Seminavis robusta]|uniref:Uncharacterized protein n=1 Tax=Seminavis robusta TaxID=568900 RepID=A0A9N8F2K6_9STRA|nr:expressed unknown protein [Seminavis robusta]|eukprot:Sro2520_g330160.1 n/a (314) ;mRNA; f:6786-7727
MAPPKADECGKKRKNDDDNAPVGKQKKIVGVHQAVSPFTNSDIVSVVTGYLGVQDLFRLAFSSKAILSVLSYEHVIRSVMLRNLDHKLIDRFAEEHPSCSVVTLANIIYQIQKERIYVPSVPRLLRLVISHIGCEACGKPRHKRDMRGHENGVALCMRCMARLTAYKNSQNAKFRHGRMAGRHDQTRVILLRSTYKSHLLGKAEPAGSILTVGDMDQWKNFETILQGRDETYNPRKHLGPDIVAAFLNIGQTEVPDNHPNYWSAQYVCHKLQKHGPEPSHRMGRPLFHCHHDFDQFVRKRKAAEGPDSDDSDD